MTYIKNKDLGFSKNQTLILPYGWSPAITDNWSVIKNDLLALPGVQDISATSSIPGDNAPYWNYKFEGTNTPDGESWAGYYVGPGFFETLDIELVKGRSFSDEIPKDADAFILNESAWQRAITEYGDHWKEPLGKIIEYYTTDNDGWQLRKRGEIIGIAKDFHYRSLHSEVEAVVIQQARGFPQSHGTGR